MERLPKRTRVAHAAGALLYVVLWSSGFIPTKVAVIYCPPITLLAARFLLASAVMWSIVRWLGLRGPATSRAWMRLSLLGLFGLAIPMSCNFIALRQVSAGTAAIVASTNPLVLALIAPRVLRERMTGRRLLGLVLGFGGVLFVMAARIGVGPRKDTPAGVCLLFAHVLSLVGATVLFKRLPPREPLLVVNAAQLLVAGCLLLLPALAFERVGEIALDPRLTVSFVYLLFVLSIGASLLWFWLLSRGEASVASSYLFLTPLFGILFAAALLGEAFTVRDGIGLLATATGIALIRR